MENQATRVIFFGASAVSEQAAIFCKLLGFEVVVLDDEPVKFQVPGFADCTCTQVDFEDETSLDAIGITSDDMVCIITRGHTHDRQAFAYALKSPAFYKGMMGSAKKNAKCFAYALEHGCTQEQIDAAYAPIGEEIGAIDAKEIGLSIAAQLVKVRNARFPREKDHDSLHAD
jgi:xanthine dehydrogenase accessory factor